MSDIKFVIASNLSSLEDYAASLVFGCVSLRSLEAFHLEAFKKGLLDEDESETGKTICWEIKRLLALYSQQMKNVLDRTAIDEQQIIDSLQKVMPDVKMPRKKPVKE